MNTVDENQWQLEIYFDIVNTWIMWMRPYTLLTNIFV